MNMNEESQNKEEDIVITPGGPRPRRLVKQVNPGEAVRSNEEGKAVVIPSKNTPAETEEEDNHDE
jgi:hypothetical protein